MAMQQLHFVKNMAIVGGLLAFATWGAGGWSLDARAGTGSRFAAA